MKANEPEKNGRIFTLCDPKTQHSCPEVEICEDSVLIRDDFGNTCRLSKRDWSILSKLIKAGEM